MVGASLARFQPVSCVTGRNTGMATMQALIIHIGTGSYAGNYKPSPLSSICSSYSYFIFEVCHIENNIEEHTPDSVTQYLHAHIKDL